MDTPRTLYKITQSSPGSEAAGEAAAALAAAYLVFRDDRDKSLATQLLAASRSVRRHVITPHIFLIFFVLLHACTHPIRPSERVSEHLDFRCMNCCCFL
jgi:hypothetical protein